MLPSARASSVTWPLSRAAKVVGAGPASLALIRERASRDAHQVLRVKWIELFFRQRPVAQSKLYRDIVKPARREAAIEMPQSRNNHPDDRDLNVGAGLIEHEEIEALLLRETTQAITWSRLSSSLKFESTSGWRTELSPGVK